MPEIEITDTPEVSENCSCHSCKWQSVFGYDHQGIKLAGQNDPTKNFAIFNRTAPGQKYGYIHLLKNMEQDDIRVAIALATEGVG